MLLALLAGTAAAQTVEPYFNSAAMERAREQARREMGGQTLTFLQAEQLEWRRSSEGSAAAWDVQGWAGSDFHRLWIKTEGETEAGGGTLETGEIQALYSKPVSSFFDVQAGVRQDLQPGGRRTYGVLGVQGLAPYQFEIDAALFVSAGGDVSARIESEYEVRLTQRMIVQPRVEADFAIQQVERFGVGRGLGRIESGVRVRYELKRQFAPYWGVEWQKAVGGTGRMLREAGGDAGGWALTGGLRLWF